MKTKILKTGTIALLLFLVVGSAIGQRDKRFSNRKKDMEKIQTMRIAYITDMLSLSPEEAEKFWPVYNAFKDKKMEHHKSFKEEHAELIGDKEIEELSEQEATSLYEMHREHMKTMHNLEVEYMEKFREVLPIKKVVMLKKAEDGFKKHLLNELRGRHGRPHEMPPDKPPLEPHHAPGEMDPHGF